jgi:hypothetical protein
MAKILIATDFYNYFNDKMPNIRIGAQADEKHEIVIKFLLGCITVTIFQIMGTQKKSFHDV